MAMIEWFLKGKEFGNCNCSYGCPCQFNALPTHGNCMAMCAYRFDEGRFGDVELGGLRAAATWKWPGAVHQGNGTMQLIIDERADARQRDALVDGDERQGDRGPRRRCGGSIRRCARPSSSRLFKPIEFEVDVDARRAHLLVPGIIETVGEPIRNPVTGAEHRARIDLPNGFEYRLGEVASGTTKATGGVKLDFQKTFGLCADIHLSHAGVVD